MNHAAHGLIIINPRGLILDINDYARALLGIDSQRVIGKALTIVLSASDVEFGSLPIDQENFNREIVHARSARRLLWKGSPLRAAKNGLAGSLIEIHDITEQRANEAAVQQSFETAKELEILKNLAEILNQTLLPNDALQAGLEMIAQQVQAKFGWILSLTDNQKSRLTASYRIPNEVDLAHLQQNEQELCECMVEAVSGKSEAPIFINTCVRLMRAKKINDQLPQHHLSIPVRAGGVPIGIINLVTQNTIPFTESELRLLSALGDQFGGAIERAKLFEAVHTLAITDPLTGLANRRYFFEQVTSELNRADRYSHPVAIVMLDIDLFKHINDTYGHLCGDQVLRGFANILREEVRRVDLPARYGGEEMIILLPETDLPHAMQTAERLRSKIEQTEFETMRGRLTVTASFGVTICPADWDCPLQTLIERADIALYEAKNSGRNQVIAWESLDRCFS